MKIAEGTSNIDVTSAKEKRRRTKGKPEHQPPPPQKSHILGRHRLDERRPLQNYYTHDFFLIL